MTTATTIWTIISSFITGFFGVAGEVISAVMANDLLATLVIGVPVFSIVVSLTLKLANLRRGKKRKG